MSFGNNTTDPLSEPGIKNYALGATLVVINVTIVCLNGLAVLVITRFRNKSAIDVLVLGLALTDLVKGVIPIPMSVVVYLTTWFMKAGHVECDFFGWIAFATNSNSMLILTLMSFERYLAIGRPFAYKGLVTPKRVTVAVTVAGGFSMCHSALPLMGAGRMKPFYDGAYCHFDYSRTYSEGTRAYSLFVLSYGFLLIAVVMFSYSIVFYKIRDLIKRHRRMSRKISRVTTVDNSHDKGSSTADRRAIKLEAVNLKTERMFSYLTVALIALFWFSWLPFLSVVLISQLGIATPHKQVDLFAIRVAVVNSLLNPVACALLCKPYRRGGVFYMKKLMSYAGFPDPSSDVFDPWSPRRRSSTGRNSFQSKKTSYSPSRNLAYSTEASMSHTDSGLGGQVENYYAEFPIRVSSSSDVAPQVHGRYNAQPSPGSILPSHPLFTLMESHSNYEVQVPSETPSVAPDNAVATSSESSGDESDDSGIDREQAQALLPSDCDRELAGPSNDCEGESSSDEKRRCTRKLGYCPVADGLASVTAGRRLKPVSKARRSLSWLGRRKSFLRSKDEIKRMFPKRSCSFSSPSEAAERYPLNNQSRSDDTQLSCAKQHRNKSRTDSHDRQLRSLDTSCLSSEGFGVDGGRGSRDGSVNTVASSSSITDRVRSYSHCCSAAKAPLSRPYSKRYSMPDMQTGLEIIDSLTKELVALSATVVDKESK